MPLGAVIGTMAVVRWSKVETIAYGIPAVVFHDGRVLEEVLYTQRLRVDDLLDAAREKGIGDLQELEIAALEPDGQFSFVRLDRSEPDPQLHKRD